MKIFSLFSESHNTFEGIESDEHVILLIRRHPFFIILKSILIIFLFILPCIVSYIFYDFLLSYHLVTLFIFIFSLWCLILWQVLFYNLTMYILDVWIVTNKRIIDSTQHGFFNRSTAELHHERIQDISVKVTGLIPSFLDFGDLEIQTAGTENKFDFLQIPNPNEVKNQIMAHVSGKISN